MKSKLGYISSLAYIYISLGPIAWFGSFTLGFIKRLILLLIIIGTINYFKPSKIKGFFCFIAISTALGVSLFFTDSYKQEDLSYVLLGVLEDYLFFIIGYNIERRNVLDNNKSYKYLLLLPLLTCFLTIMNYTTGYPSWTAPGETERYIEFSQYGYEIPDLWETGFSWGRNGWGCSLAILAPFCFLWKNRKLAIFTWSVLALSVFICGNRNGLLAIILSLFMFYYFYFKHTRASHFSSFKIILMCLIFIGVFGYDFVISNLRLNSGDVTSGRNLQYLLIPSMISQMSFWGLGHNGTRAVISGHGLGNYVLHTTYFRILIEYGWIVGISLFTLIINVIIKIKSSIVSKNKIQVILSCILISGLMVALFEPMVVFGSLGGYASWWFALGYLTKIQETKCN